MKTYLLLAATLLLAACSTSASQRPYYWDNYPDTVYQSIGKQTPDEQVDALEAYLQEAMTDNRAVAPGVYAQLGMLYVEIGQDKLAEKAFLEEKKRFPETERFMNFLLKKPVLANKTMP